MTGTRDIISIDGVSKSFGDNVVLEPTSFSVRRGEFLSVLGPSGCGKTTLLRILVGLECPDAGRVVVDGRDVTADPPSSRRMGIVFQDYALFENMTALGNVEYPMRFRPGLRSGARTRAVVMLDRVGLTDFADAPVSSLSGGQRQRVSIARTLALEPEIILFDEALSALDAEVRLALRDDLKNIQYEFGTTMVFVTHDQEEALALSDRVLVMGEGRVRQLGTPVEIVSDPADAFVRGFVVGNLSAKTASLRRFSRWL